MKQQQHYISKILTKPWEQPNSGRHLWHLDCEKNQILQSSSKSLFSKNDLWPKEYEDIFDKKFEGRLTADIRTIIFGKPKRDIESSSEAIRSILTLHHFNAMRSMRVHWGFDDIDRFTRLSSKERLEEIESFAIAHSFIALPLNLGHQYFFPESAFFRIPVYNNATNEMDFGFAIPLHPNYAFGIFPKDFNRAEASKISDSSLVTLSIGTNFDKKIIIPSSYITDVHNINLLEVIKKARLKNIHELQFVMDHSESLRKRRDAVMKSRSN